MGSNTIRRVETVTFDEAGNVPDDGSGASFSAIHQQLCRASAMIGSMDDRGVVEMDLDKADHILTFVGNDANLNVFNVNAEDWSGSGMDIVIVAPIDSTVVFNIHGAHINLSVGAIRLTGVANDHILFNYVDATEILTASFTHEGAVLAPFSGGRFTGGAFEGFGFFGGNVETAIGFEFHHFPFRGRICTEAEASPAVRLSTTAGDAEDGAVLTVLGGSGVTVSYQVANTGNTWLDHVRVVDSALGEIGTLAERLAPCSSATLTAFLPSVEEDCVLHGTVTGRAVREDGTLWNGYVGVSDSDDASIKIGSPAGGEGEADPVEAWQRPDFAVTSIEFVDEPTLTGEVFSVFVTVENHGELAGDAGRLSLYTSKPSAATAGQLGDASMSVGVLMPGDSKTLKFSSVKAAGTAGTHHLRAYVDSLDSVHEWSEGDNQLAVTYDLNAIYMGIAVTEEGTELSWNSFPGQKYTLFRCTDLTKGFLLYKSHIESTPPTNTYIDAESTGMRFYRLSVEK
jgi:choice-of-anchor A domain-containing protein